MRRPLALVLLFLSVTQFSFAGAKPMTGKDWLLMSYEEKVLSSATVMDVLKKKGVPMEKNFEQYIALMDEAIMDKFEYRERDVTKILASIIYETEPGSRDALKQTLLKPEVKKIAMH